MNPSNIIYVGFSKQVVALDRATGTIVWYWKIPRGKAYPALLVDGEQVFVSAMGYTYCLDAYTGQLIWENELAGMGTGVACIATASGHTDSSRAAADLARRQESSQQQSRQY